jgi:hypothetical protein
MEALSPPGTGRHQVQVIEFLLIYCVFIFLKGRNKDRKKERKKEREEKKEVNFYLNLLFIRFFLLIRLILFFFCSYDLRMQVLLHIPLLLLSLLLLCLLCKNRWFWFYYFWAWYIWWWVSPLEIISEKFYAVSEMADILHSIWNGC